MKRELNDKTATMNVDVGEGEKKNEEKKILRQHSRIRSYEKIKIHQRYASAQTHTPNETDVQRIATEDIQNANAPPYTNSSIVAVTTAEKKKQNKNCNDEQKKNENVHDTH